MDGWTTNNYSVPAIPGVNAFVWLLPENWSSGNTTSSTLSAFTQNGDTTVNLCVTAFLPGCPLDTACLEVHVFISIGVDEPAGNAGIWFAVRPNPSRGIFELVRTDNGRDAFQMVVFDATGRAVPTRTLHAGQRVSTLDLGDAAPGVYFLRMTVGDQNQVVRLMIER